MAQLRSRNPDPPCISSLYNEQCLPKFQEACSLLEQPDGDLAFRKSLPILLDEVGRLRAWAGNSGARREPRHKLSLDYRLREASHLHLGFTELLGDLNQNLEDALALLSGEGTSEPPEIVDDSSDSDTSSSCHPEQTHSHDGELKTPLDYLVTDITHVITCLYRFSMTIQNPAPKDRLHKCKDIKISHFEPYELLHARDKFPTAPSYLVERLAKANTRRRQLIKYYERHHTKISGRTEPGARGLIPRVEGVSGYLGSSAGPTRETFVEEEPNPAHFQTFGGSGRPASERTGTISTALNSHTTLSTFVDRPGLSTNYNLIDSVEVESETTESQTSFASSSGGMSRLWMPQPPSALDDKPFECPYCFSLIRPRTVHSWMRHVLQDLQPYICTFKDCAKPDRLFNKRRDWYDHEVEVHRRHWFCKTCSTEYATPGLLKQHILMTHERLSDNIEFVIQRCEGTIQAEQNCPLCSEAFLPTALRGHLARHLQEVALFALPRMADTDDDKTVNSRLVQASFVNSDSSNGSIGESEDSEHSQDNPDETQPDVAIASQQPFGRALATHQPFASSSRRTTRTETETEVPFESDPPQTIVVKVGESFITVAPECDRGDISTCPLQPIVGPKDTDKRIHQLRHQIAKTWGVEVETLCIQNSVQSLRSPVIDSEFMENLATLSVAVPDADEALVYIVQSYNKAPKNFDAGVVKGALDIVTKVEWVENLHQAALAGDLSRINSIWAEAQREPLLHPPNIDATARGSGLTALHLAAWAGHADVVGKLLEYGASVDTVHEDSFGEGNNALQSAAAAGHDNIVRLLFAAGATKLRSSVITTPFHLAVKNRHIEVVKTLLHVDLTFVDSQEYGRYDTTPLQLATDNGDEAMIRLLVGAGAGVDGPDPTWHQLLRPRDSKSNRPQLVGGLRLVGVYGPPLFIAAKKGFLNIVKYLFDEGASISLETTDGEYNALHVASEMGHDEVVQLFTESGMINEDHMKIQLPLLHNPVTGVGLLMTALQVASLRGYSGIVNALLACSFGLGRPAKSIIDKTLVPDLLSPSTAHALIGGTALHLACMYQHASIVSELLDRGAGVNIQTQNGDTPMIFACHYGNMEILRILLRWKANVNLYSEGSGTAVFVAAKNGHLEIVNLLLGYGADVNVRHNGISVLDVANKGYSQNHMNIARVIGGIYARRNQDGP